jgi:hypothetical protein
LRGWGEDHREGWLVIYAIGWVLIGLTAYPRIFGYFQNAYPSIAEETYRADLAIIPNSSLYRPALVGEKASWGNEATWVVVISKPMNEELAEKSIREAGYRSYLPDIAKSCAVFGLTKPAGASAHDSRGRSFYVLFSLDIYSQNYTPISSGVLYFRPVE